METCASCLQGIQQVWDLQQQIEAIRISITRIVYKVAASISKNGEGRQEITGFNLLIMNVLLKGY